MENRAASPTLTNVVFSGNSATDGAGMFNSHSSPTPTSTPTTTRTPTVTVTPARVVVTGPVRPAV